MCTNQLIYNLILVLVEKKNYFKSPSWCLLSDVSCTTFMMCESLNLFVSIIFKDVENYRLIPRYDWKPLHSSHDEPFFVSKMLRFFFTWIFLVHCPCDPLFYYTNYILRCLRNNEFFQFNIVKQVANNLDKPLVKLIYKSW